MGGVLACCVGCAQFGTVASHAPACKNKLSETIGKLRTNPQLTCRCGKIINVEANQLNAGIESVEQSLANLRRAIRSIGKS